MRSNLRYRLENDGAKTACVYEIRGKTKKQDINNTDTFTVTTLHKKQVFQERFKNIPVGTVVISKTQTVEIRPQVDTGNILVISTRTSEQRYYIYTDYRWHKSLFISRAIPLHLQRGKRLAVCTH